MLGIRPLFICAVVFRICFSCYGTGSNVQTSNNVEKEQITDKNRLLITTVNSLNIRNDPDTNSKVIALVKKEGIILNYTGIKTTYMDVIVLRERQNIEPWYKILLSGWVFGGGVEFSDKNQYTRENENLSTVVTDLRIRDQPDTTSEVVALIKKEGTIIGYTGTKTTNKDMIVLRGRQNIEPWYEVSLSGWVFGGTVEFYNNMPPSIISYNQLKTIADMFKVVPKRQIRKAGEIVSLGNQGEQNNDYQIFDYDGELLLTLTTDIAGANSAEIIGIQIINDQRCRGTENAKNELSFIGINQFAVKSDLMFSINTSGQFKFYK